MTQNIDGHSRSLDSCQQLIKRYKPDVFLRQEDWLFTFQQFMLNQVDKEYFGIGKSVDCNEKSLVKGNTKAKWGLDILFKKSKPHFAFAFPSTRDLLLQSTDLPRPK